MQRQLFQPHSQTRCWWFSQQGWCGQRSPSFVHINAQGPTPLAPVYLHCITLPVCICAPHLCMSRPDRFPPCSCRHSQPRPFRLCKSTPEGSTSLVFASAFTAPRPAPHLCMPTHEGLTMFTPAFAAGFSQFCMPTPSLLPHRRSQPRPPLKFQVQVCPSC